jgi:hypothetical protein
VRCGEVVVVSALNRRRRSVWGGGEDFSRRGRRRARVPSRTPAGSLRLPAMRRLGAVRVNVCRKVRPGMRPSVQAAVVGAAVLGQGS